MVELKFTLLFCYFLTAITWMHRENQCYISECVLEHIFYECTNFWMSAIVVI